MRPNEHETIKIVKSINYTTLHMYSLCDVLVTLLAFYNGHAHQRCFVGLKS